MVYSGCTSKYYRTKFQTQRVGGNMSDNSTQNKKSNNIIDDVEVTNETGLFVPNNCIKVKGMAIKSKSLKKSGEE